MITTERKAWLLLEDGTLFEGKSFGATGSSIGEVIFSTSMAGYQEALSDPTYYGQILTQTFPLIGNYGVNGEDMSSDRCFCRAILSGNGATPRRTSAVRVTLINSCGSRASSDFTASTPGT